MNDLAEAILKDELNNLRAKLAQAQTERDAAIARAERAERERDSAIASARAAEREDCAQIADTCANGYIAAIRIRARTALGDGKD